MGHNNVVLGHPKSTRIPRVDELSTGLPDLGCHNLSLSLFASIFVPLPHLPWPLNPSTPTSSAITMMMTMTMSIFSILIASLIVHSLAKATLLLALSQVIIIITNVLKIVSDRPVQPIRP